MDNLYSVLCFNLQFPFSSNVRPSLSKTVHSSFQVCRYIRFSINLTYLNDMAISGERVISPSMNSKATVVAPTDHSLTSEGNLSLKYLVCSNSGYYDQNNFHFPTEHPLRAEGKWKIKDGNNDVEQGLCIQWLYYEPTYMRTLNRNLKYL